MREAAEALAYRPNRIAHSLRVRSTRLAGVLIPDVQNPFFTAVVRGVEDLLHSEGWTLLLGNSDDHPEREQAHLRTLSGEGVAGVVLVPGQPGEAYHPLVQSGLAMVAIDRAPEGLDIDRVMVANAEGAAAAVAHLVARGHRRIAFVGGPEAASTAVMRRAGYERALREAGIVSRARRVESGDFRPGGGRAAMERLLARENPPSAVFVANDLMTLGVYEALRSRCISIPGGMAVVGFDDAPWAPWLDPPLTTVAQPAYELGVTAARLLLERLREPGRPVRQVVLGTRLVVRQSCGTSKGKTPPLRSPSSAA